jgi:hypothetical protein
MISHVLLAIVVAATFGLSACEKTEEPEAEQQAPETGAVEKEKTIVEQATEVVKEGTEKASEMAHEAMGKTEEATSPAMEEGAETAGTAKEEGAERAEETTGAPASTGQ